MSQTILGTGATGNLGREVITTLLGNGYTSKAGTRDVEKVTGQVPLTFAIFAAQNVEHWS